MQIDQQLMRSIDRRLDEQKSLLIHLDRQGRQNRDRKPIALDRPASLVARAAACHLLAKTARSDPERIARQHFAADRDLAHLIQLKAGVSPAMTEVTTWAAELVGTVVADIATNLLPASALTQLRAASGQPYAFVEGGVVKVPIHSPIASGAFVAEGNAIPLGALILSATTLPPKKAASIIAVTKELLAGSPLNVEISLQTLLAQDLGLMIDGVLLSNAAATAAAPAGLLAGVTPLTPTAGGGSGAMLGDVKKLLAAVAPALKPVMIVSSGQAATIGILEPPIGVPTIVAPYLAADQVVMIDAAAFASALGVPDFNINENPTVHMETVPLPIATGAQGSGVLATPTSSLWQTACVGMRTLIDCNWALRRAGAVATITGVTW